MRLQHRLRTSACSVVRIVAALSISAAAWLSASVQHQSVLLADEDPPVFVDLWGVENDNGTAPGEFDDPRGIAVGADGKVYVADTDNNRIQVLNSGGTPLLQWTGFNGPEGIAVDSSGNVYVADTDNHRVVVVDSSGAVLHVLDGHDAGSDNFQYPSSIAVTPDGTTLYIADTYNHCVHIYTLAEGTYGHAETIGDYELPGTLNEQFNNPYGVDVGPDGSVYVADTSNRRIQKFDADGDFVWARGEYGGGNGQFWDPAGVTVDSEGNVWVADTGNSRIQKFTSSGDFIMTFGTGGSGDYRFSYPDDLAITSDGTILVADTGNHCIKLFQPASFFAAPPVLLSTWGSSGTCGDGDLCNPLSIAIDDDGYVFVGTANSDRVQKFDSNGGFIATWGTLGAGAGQVSDPNGIALDTQGTIYVADTMNHRIQVLTWNETEERYESEVLSDDDDPLYYPHGVALDATDGILYVADTSHSRVQQLDIASGEWSIFAGTGVWGSAPGQFASPRGIAVDQATGWVYVVDSYNNCIQKFGSDGSLLDHWGSNGQYAGQFYAPWAVAVDYEGNVYVVEYGNCRVQKFDSDGSYLTQWGSGGSGDGQFNSPSGVAVHPNGSIYVADTGNNRIQVFGDADGFLTVEAGWNMVSVPLQPDNPARGSVFPGATVYEWIAADNQYGQPDEIAPGIGYWLKADTAQTIPLFGTPVPLEEWQCEVSAGWTMLGSPGEAITVSDLWNADTGQPLVHDGVYAWNPGEPGYTLLNPSGELTPGHFYWLACGSGCTVTRAPAR